MIYQIGNLELDLTHKFGKVISNDKILFIGQKPIAIKMFAKKSGNKKLLEKFQHYFIKKVEDTKKPD